MKRVVINIVALALGLTVGAAIVVAGDITTAPKKAQVAQTR